MGLILILLPRDQLKVVNGHESQSLCRLAAESALSEARTIFPSVCRGQLTTGTETFFSGLLPPFAKEAQSQYEVPIDTTVKLFKNYGLSVENCVKIERLDGGEFNGRAQGLLSFKVAVAHDGVRLTRIEYLRFFASFEWVENGQKQWSVQLREGPAGISDNWSGNQSSSLNAVSGAAYLQRTLRCDLARLDVDEGIPMSPRTPHRKIKYEAEKGLLTLTLSIPNKDGRFKSQPVVYSFEPYTLPSGKAVKAVYRKEGDGAKRLLQGVLVSNEKVTKLAARKRMRRVDYLVIDYEALGPNNDTPLSSTLFIALRNCPWKDYLKSYSL
mgnify:CR=1 FL=1